VLRLRSRARAQGAGAVQDRSGHPEEHLPVLQHQGELLGCPVPTPGRESTSGRAGAAGLFCRVPPGPPGRRLFAAEPAGSRVANVFHFFSLVQVLGIKVETKVQCEVLNPSCSLLFPALSVRLLLGAPLESSPVPCPQQRCSARGHRESRGSCCSSSPGAPSPVI